MDFNALLAEKKKKANENQNQKPFGKHTKIGSSNNTQRQMPMRKTGRGK